MQNELRMTLLSLSANESFARAAVASFAAQLDPTVEEISDLKTAVSEAVTNCIVHAYGNAVGKISLLVRLREDGSVLVRVQDKGCGIPDIAKAMEPLFTTGGEERAGLGFAVMESFTDKLRVRSAVGKGTTITMEKRLRRRES